MSNWKQYQSTTASRAPSTICSSRSLRFWSSGHLSPRGPPGYLFSGKLKRVLGSDILSWLHFQNFPLAVWSWETHVPSESTSSTKTSPGTTVVKMKWDTVWGKPVSCVKHTLWEPVEVAPYLCTFKWLSFLLQTLNSYPVVSGYKRSSWKGLRSTALSFSFVDFPPFRGSCFKSPRWFYCIRVSTTLLNTYMCIVHYFMW